MYFTYPNVLTVLRIIITPFFIYYFLSPAPDARLLAAMLFFLASFTDWLDGKLARKLNLTTRIGQFLDPVADKVLVSSALLSLAYLNYMYLWMVLIIIGRDILITALRMYALHHGKVIITTTFAKWKTFAQMGFVFVMILYLAIPSLPDIRLTSSWSDWLRWPTISAFIVVILTTASGTHYLVYNRIHVIEIFRRIIRSFSR